MYKRHVFRMAATLLAIVVMPLVVDAQQRGRGGRPGGGFGGGFSRGGGGAELMLALIRVDKVQKELELIEEQVNDATKLSESLRQGRGERPARGERPRNLSDEEREKLREQFAVQRRKRDQEIREKLGTILLPPQLERLEQIVIQVQGVGALDDPAVAEKLKITPQQREKMAAARQELGQSMRARMQELFQGDRENFDREKMREEMAKLQEQVQEKTLGQLTAEQKKQFEAMKGEKFEISRADLSQGRGRFGRGRGGAGGRGRPGERPERPERPE